MARPAAPPAESPRAARPVDDGEITPERAAIRRYYEASTSRFLRIGGSGQVAAIHRGLWPEGVRDAAEAADQINIRLAELAERLLGRPPARVRDLGCGVGGTLLHLASRWPGTQLDGVTLSAEQVRIAGRLIAERGQTARLRVAQGDFLAPDPGMAPADLVLAIESHVHAPSARAFLKAALQGLAPGGLLVIVDDMLSRPEHDLTPREAARLSTFRRGWHLGHVTDPARLVSEAQALGLEPVAQEDLTQLLNLARARDIALRAAGPLADAMGLGRWPLFANMIGGNALTESYRAGTMRYVMAAFQRPAGVP